jgi:hypothetical protein
MMMALVALGLGLVIAPNLMVTVDPAALLGSVRVFVQGVGP